MQRCIRTFQLIVFAAVSVCLQATAHADSPSSFDSRILKSGSELDYPPFALVLPDGSADGFSVELLKAVTQTMGLGLEITVGPCHELKQKLENGELDVLPLVSYTR